VHVTLYRVLVEQVAWLYRVNHKVTTSEISAQLYLGVFCDTLRSSLVIHGSKFMQLTRGIYYVGAGVCQLDGE
jgi:hypothetical protein